VSSYNDFSRSFESRVIVSARKMQEKGIEIGKREIEDVPLVEGAPRYGGDETPLIGDAASDKAAKKA
jgi:DNA recombination protein RmuC